MFKGEWLKVGVGHSVRQGQGLASKRKVVWLYRLVRYLITYDEILLPAFGTLALSSVKSSWRQGIRNVGRVQLFGGLKVSRNVLVQK